MDQLQHLRHHLPTIYARLETVVKPELPSSVSTVYSAELADACVVRELGCSPTRGVTGRRTDTNDIRQSRRDHSIITPSRWIKFAARLTQPCKGLHPFVVATSNTSFARVKAGMSLLSGVITNGMCVAVPARLTAILRLVLLHFTNSVHFTK